MGMSVLSTILINAIPLGILAIPLAFLHNRGIAGKIYLRFYCGICVFFAIYWILPTIFQLNSISPMNSDQDAGLGVGFVFARLASLVGLYIQLPLTQFPFIFLVSPFIAFLLIRRQLKKEDGTMAEKLDALTWEYSKSPLEQIKERLESGDWAEVKQLFKLLVVLLPVSLYLLTTLLDILNVKSTSFLSTGSTALGWFMEILFAYLASFLMGIHLSASSRVSFKGRFIGEKMREEAFSSLTTVGAPISILSIVLFVAKALQQASIDSIYVTIYFFGYFIMAALIFVSILAIFEPISIFIMIKVINWWKQSRKSSEKFDWKKVGTSILIGLVGGFVGFLIIAVMNLIINFIDPNLQIFLTNNGSTDVTKYYSTIFGSGASPTLSQVTAVELNTFVNTCQILGVVFAMGILLALSVRFTQGLLSGVIPYIMGGVIVTILFGNGLIPLQFGSGSILWLTTTPVTTNVFGDPFYTMRLMFLGASSNITTLDYLGAPYSYSRTTLNIIWFGLFIFYSQRKFTTRSVSDGEFVHRTTFTYLDIFPIEREIQVSPQKYFCTINPDKSIPETSKAEVKETFSVLSEGVSATELMSKLNLDLPTAYKRLRFLFQKRFANLWQAEFSYSFKEAQLKGLNIMYSDGRDVFSHQFQESNVDPALVAGMFSAITIFIKETTKSTDLLRSIDHGDTSVIIEYGKYVFAAIFADRETSDVRAKLREFIEEFEDRHGSILVKWNGNMAPFEEDQSLVKKIFL